MRRPPKQKRDDEKPLLSASTILILSGFLIGLTVGRVVGEDLSPFVLASGLAGFLAYLGLDVAAAKRKEEFAAAQKSQMEQRLDKHVMSLSAVGFVLPDRVEEEPISPTGKTHPRIHTTDSLEYQLSQL